MLDKYTRRGIRREGWKNVKRRFFLNILIIFITSLIVNGGYSMATRGVSITDNASLEKTMNVVQETHVNGIMGMDNNKSKAEIVLSFILNIFEVSTVPDPEKVSSTSAKYYGGVASVFVNEISGSRSFAFGIINGLNEVIFKGRVASSVIIFIFSIISIFSMIFLKNVIIVGKNRYYLEQRRYADTGPGELLFPYKNKRLKNIAFVMFIRYLFQLLWDLTLVGGVIKHYEYKLIPYILAENPKISKKDAFAISKQMMHGNKYRVFLIEFSMIPWYILSFLTFNISGFLFSDAYIECVTAELYMKIRELKKDELSVELRSLLNDDMLAINHIESGEHPSGVEVLDIPTIHRSTFKSDYMRKYSFISLIELFFTYSLVGWLWEVGLYLATTGQFINRGTMHGPWLPIYGCGGLLIILLLRPLREQPRYLFVGAVGVCGGVEYFTSWLLEKLFNQKWWDYTGYFLNINGRVCFEGLLVFGMAGLAFTYVFSPMLDDLYQKMSKKHRIILCIILLVIFAADLVWSLLSPNVGDGVTSGLI